MPQGPIAVADANLIPQGAKSVKNISVATVLKATPGTVLGIAVLTAGSAGTTQINDCATTGAVSSPGNQVYSLLGTTSAGNLLINPIPCTTGIVVTPATGQVLSVWFV